MMKFSHIPRASAIMPEKAATATSLADADHPKQTERTAPWACPVWATMRKAFPDFRTRTSNFSAFGLGALARPARRLKPSEQLVTACGHRKQCSNLTAQ